MIDWPTSLALRTMCSTCGVCVLCVCVHVGVCVCCMGDSEGTLSGLVLLAHVLVN